MTEGDPEILIEGRDFTRQEGGGGGGPRYSPAGRLGIRIVALFAAALFAVWFAFSAAFTLLFTLLYLVTVGRIEALPAAIERQWRGVQLSLALLLGALVAIIAPRFGIGIALLYMTIHAESRAAGSFTDQFQSRFQATYNRF